MEKANLFFVWTPFQLFVAQNIIIQEKLKHNILVYGYNGNNTHFYEVYELLKKDALWERSYQVDWLSSYALIERKKIAKSISRMIKNDKVIEDIIRKENAGSLYLGDINNVSCHFTAFRYAPKGIKINFYEEGTKHYFFEETKIKGGYIKSLLRTLFWDLCVYLPRFGFRYAKWLFLRNITFHDLPISKRYSIVPKFNTEVDKVLTISDLCTDKLSEYIKEEIAAIKQKDEKRLVLFLTQPLDYDWGSFEVLGEVIEDYFSYDRMKDDVVVVKFHPRETDERKKTILAILEKNKVDYHVLSADYVIPVEIFLNKISFSKIVYFYTSTLMYADYIFPKIPSISILSEYITKCKERGMNMKALEDIIYQLQDNAEFNNIYQPNK